MESLINKECWIFDSNHRVYPPNRLSISGSPIWRKHWVKHTIVSENSRSWITNFGAKVPKKNPPNSVCFSEAEIDKREWVHKHAMRIGSEVGRFAEYDVLQEIASLIGYEEK